MDALISFPCHVCGGRLRPLSGFSTLLQVTSDCRPWRAGGVLAACQACEAIQKPATPEWKSEAEDIYAGYEMYSQGGGVEQSTFDAASGANTARSNKIVEWLSAAGKLPDGGKLLDIGCGNGSFLRSFAERHPRWTMHGLELSERNRPIIEAIPGVARLHVGSIFDVDERFDLIVLIHALEHIPDPTSYLASLLTKLNTGGRVLIEVPDLDCGPFDILIADHVTHFTAQVLHRVVSAAGFTPQVLQSDFVPKELSLLAQGGSDAPRRMDAPVFSDGPLRTSAHIAWLQSIIDEAKAVQGVCGIFGTSISATWLAASLADQVTFFVDEDRNRIGRSHMGRRILHPSDAPSKSSVLIPLRGDIARAVAERYSQRGHRFIVPPPEANS